MPDDRERRRGLAALLGVQLCFGLFPFALKHAYAGFAPAAIVAWRIPFGAVAIGLLALARFGPARLVPPRRDVGGLLLLGLFGVVVNQMLALHGMERTTTIEAALLMTSIPVFTAGLALATRQERFDGARLLGLVLAIAGAAILNLARLGSGGLGEGALGGNLLILANCFSYSLFLILARPLVARHPPTLLLFWVFAGACLALPWIARGEELLPAAAPAGALVALGWVLVFPTFVAYLLNTYALKRVGAATTAVFIFLQPVVAAAAGIPLLGERLRPSVLVAAALLFAGIRLVARRPELVAPPQPSGASRSILRSAARVFHSRR